jgi:hypothetical protein
MRMGLVVAALCCLTACGDNDNGNGNENGNDNGGTSPTFTPGAVRTPTPGVATATAGVPTGQITPTGGGTPGPTSTAPPQIPCPQLVTYQVLASESDLDTGWTGVYGGIPAGDGGSLTFAVDCPGEFLGECGSCSLTGPVQSTTVINNQRCDVDTSIECTSNADCPSGGCSFYFGSPLAVSGGGLPICTLNRVAGPVTGTIVPELGSGDSNFPLELGFHTGIEIDRPCPTCSGNGLDTTGVCDGGPRNGQACTVHGVGVLGQTSFDCPPDPIANIGTTLAPFNLTTGTRTLEATATCTGAGPAGRACYCEGQEQPNACTDGVCTVGADGQGICASGPVDRICDIEFFRGCLTDADCPLEGDSCIDRQRECLGPATAEEGATGPLTRVGTPSTTLPLQVGVFCIDATRTSAVNTTIGVPGPGAIRLPTTICIFPECPLGGGEE